jgi:hypothetical protein
MGYVKCPQGAVPSKEVAPTHNKFVNVRYEDAMWSLFHSK